MIHTAPDGQVEWRDLREARTQPALDILSHGQRDPAQPIRGECCGVLTNHSSPVQPEAAQQHEPLEAVQLVPGRRHLGKMKITSDSAF